MIDSHCHLEFGHFDEDREEVIGESKERLEAVVDSCAEIDTSEDVLELRRENPEFVFPSLGLHPRFAANISDRDLRDYEDKIEEVRSEIVAVGEVGLDYYHIKDSSERKRCEEVFLEFVEFSNSLDLPLVVHSRDSMADALDILEKIEGEVIIHCFSGNIDQLRESLDRGYYISLGGMIFRVKDKFSGIIEEMPLENLLLETDAPFLAKEKGERSEPWFVREVAERIAEVKGISFSEVWKTAGINAVKVFDLPIEV